MLSIVRSIPNPNPALEGIPMTDTAFQAFLAALGPAAVLTPEEQATHNAKASRAQATRNCRARKVAERNDALDSVNGDRESLCRIHLWEPLNPADEDDAKQIRDTRWCPTEMKFMALDRELKSRIGNDEGQAMRKMTVESDEVQYKLVAHIVPRARHPDEEVAFAKLQGRYRESKPSIQGFFHKPKSIQGDRRTRRVHPAPLGDFEWCERDEALTREQQINRSLRALRAARPIRNVKEAAN